MSEDTVSTVVWTPVTSVTPVTPVSVSVVRTFRTVTAVEYRMATRSRLAWLAIMPLLVVSCLVAVTSHDVLDGPLSVRIGGWALMVNIFTTLGIGVALADRLVRTYGLGLDQLLSALPAGPFTRLLGGLAGSLAAALTPVVAVMAGVGIVVAVVDRDVLAIPSALAAFAVLILPSTLLMVVAASTAGLILPLPAVRVLAIVVWFWSTLFNRSIVPLPTPTGTLLSPLGDYAASAGWGVAALWAAKGHPSWLSPAVSSSSAVANVFALLALSAIGLLVAWGVSGWKRRKN